MSILPDLAAGTVVVVTVQVMQTQPVPGGAAMTVTHMSCASITNAVPANGVAITEQVGKLARSVTTDALLNPQGAGLHQAPDAAT